MDDCLSEDPIVRPTFSSILASGSLSPEEMNISLDSLMPPQEWGEPFAHGSTASIYRARVRNSRSTVVVKRLNVPLNNATSTVMNERITYLTENRHPNLAKYYGSYFSPLTSLIFMEYLPMGDLYTAIHSDQKKSFIAWDAQDGLAFLHSLDPPLVHFDIKSKNVLLGNNLVAKIADLDSARAQPSMQLSVHSSTKKTLQWTAPELFRGKHVSKKVDVYSLAIVIWEILTQKIPWDGMIEFEVMGKLFNGQRPDIPPTASSHVRLMLEKGWANNPDQRLSAQDVADAMQEEVNRHSRSVLREAQYLSIEPGSLPLEFTEPVVVTRQRAPSSPVIYNRSDATFDDPSQILRRKAIAHESPALSPRGMRRTRSTDNFPDAIFTSIKLSPPPQQRVLKRTESLSNGLRSRSELSNRNSQQLRLDSRSEYRSDSKLSSRSDLRAEGRRNSFIEHTRSERTPDSMLHSSLDSWPEENRSESVAESWTHSRPASWTDNRPSSETDQIVEIKTGGRPASRTEGRTSSTPESKGDERVRSNSIKQENSTERTEHRLDITSNITHTPVPQDEVPLNTKSEIAPTSPNEGRRHLPPLRMLKRSDSNPNMANALLTRSLGLKRADTMQNFRNLLPPRVEIRNDSRTESRAESRPDSRSDSRRFTFARSESGIGLRYQIAPKLDPEPQPHVPTPREPSTPLYNRDGYNTGEIHLEQIEQFNASYLDDFIDNVTPKHAPKNPFPTLSFITKTTSETDRQPQDDHETQDTDNHETGHDEHDQSTYEPSELTFDATENQTSTDESDGPESPLEDHHYRDECEYDEEEDGSDEGEESPPHEASVSYEVNGDISTNEHGDEDYEEREKEEQNKYLEVKSSLDNVDDSADGSSMSLFFKSTK